MQDQGRVYPCEGAHTSTDLFYSLDLKLPGLAKGDVMYKRILVPVDGSHTSTLGLQEAIRLAKNQRARIRVISVVDEFVVAQNMEGYINAGDLLDTLRDGGKKAVADALALARKHAVKADAALYETMGRSVADLVTR